MWIMECEQHHTHGLLKNHTHNTNNNNNNNPLPVKLRPLMPRPAFSIASPLPAITPSSRSSFRNPNFTAWNNHQSLFTGGRDYGVKGSEMMAMMSSPVPPLVSTRWNPTPEQVQALEEMYRKGTRTPSAEQIQHIAAKLRRFGKIEGKNVFYWFQNHKARERQKKRRHEMELLAGRKILRHEDQSSPGSQSGLSRSNLEFEHPKKLLASLNCSTALQYPVSLPMGEELCQKDRWAQAAAKSTEFNCCQLDLSCCLSPNNSKDNIAAAATGAGVQEIENPCVEFNLFCPKNDDLANLDGCGIKGNDRTLELFPVKGNDLGNNNNSDDDIIDEAEGIDSGFSNAVGTSLVPNQFIEFLPTKN